MQNNIRSDLSLNHQNYLINRVIDTQQYKKTHASSTVNVICTHNNNNNHNNKQKKNWSMNTDTLTDEEEEAVNHNKTIPSHFEFHFEFGSKRPPSTVITSPEQQQSDSEEESNEYINVFSDEEEYTPPSATYDALMTYQNIMENIYVGSATGRSMAEESMPCECKYDSELDDASEACGDDTICINRMMFMECIMHDCPCGRLCRNRRFQLGQYSRVDVIRTDKKGYGLRALDDLSANTFIMEYIGEVIPQSEFIRRTRVYDAEGFRHYYFMTLKNDEIIDATKRGCLARFINHSCNPNCVTQKWVIGEELTFDYKFERYGAIAQKCYCGEYDCKGYIGASDEIEEEITESNTSSSSSSEEEEEESVHRPVIEPLESDKVQSFVKRMLNSVGKPRLVNKLLMRLKMTNADNTHGRDILKKIIRLHGLKMMKFWLSEWKYNEPIVIKVLQVLEQLPLANRNGLEDCQLFDVVQKFNDHDNDTIHQLSCHLLDKWNQLKSVYRIPKRIHLKPSATVEAAVETEVVAVKKKPKFNSTREYFDPDDDYFEYLTLDSTSSDIASIMQYPPHSIIPIAPKAMLNNSLNYNLDEIKPTADLSSTSYINDHLLTYYDCPYQLPFDWHSTVTEDGSVYYYNTTTLETQWEIPEASQEVYLNDVDLKREVGSVVTRHLSKQQSLWKGDKGLFKDLARKVTHHIVDRELQSGRRIKAIDNALRMKIEKFIDDYGSDYALKLTHRI